MGQCPLMFCTGSGNASRNDFTPLSDKVPEHLGIFVINDQVGVGAKPTDFAAMKDSLFSDGTGSF
jgi:hypothetical protein